MSEEEYNKNLDKEDLKNILRDSGVGDDAVREFDKGFDDRIENNKKIPAENLINKKAVIIKTGSVEIKAEPDIAESIEERMIDGRKYLLVPVSEFIKINDVKTKL